MPDVVTPEEMFAHVDQLARLFLALRPDRADEELAILKKDNRALYALVVQRLESIRDSPSE